MNALPQAAAPRRAAFTLLELVLAIMILGLFFSMAIVALQKFRGSAGRAECQNRLRNQVTAIFHYEAREGRLPPGSIVGPFTRFKVPDDITHGFWATMLGELEQPAAASMYRWDIHATDPDNQVVANLRIPALMCPAWSPQRIGLFGDGLTGGVADFGPVEVNPFLADIGEIGSSENFEGPLPVNGTIRLMEITDGVANTLLVVEATRRPDIPWVSPGIRVPLKEILGGTAHLGGANVAFCDGSIRYLKASLDLRVLAKLATRAGNESLDDDW